MAFGNPYANDGLSEGFARGFSLALEHTKQQAEAARMQREGQFQQAELGLRGQQVALEVQRVTNEAAYQKGQLGIEQGKLNISQKDADSMAQWRASESRKSDAESKRLDTLLPYQIQQAKAAIAASGAETGERGAQTQLALQQMRKIQDLTNAQETMAHNVNLQQIYSNMDDNTFNSTVDAGARLHQWITQGLPNGKPMSDFGINPQTLTDFTNNNYQSILSQDVGKKLSQDELNRAWRSQGGGYRTIAGQGSTVTSKRIVDMTTNPGYNNAVIPLVEIGYKNADGSTGTFREPMTDPRDPTKQRAYQIPLSNIENIARGYYHIAQGQDLGFSATGVPHGRQDIIDHLKAQALSLNAQYPELFGHQTPGGFAQTGTGPGGTLGIAPGTEDPSKLFYANLLKGTGVQPDLNGQAANPTEVPQTAGSQNGVTQTAPPAWHTSAQQNGSQGAPNQGF